MRSISGQIRLFCGDIVEKFVRVFGEKNMDKISDKEEKAKFFGSPSRLELFMKKRRGA